MNNPNHNSGAGAAPHKRRDLKFQVTVEGARSENPESTVSHSATVQGPHQTGGVYIPPRPEQSRNAQAPKEGATAISDKDSSYQTVTPDMLPSGFNFYPFDRLSIRRFGVADLKKLYHAQATNKFRTLVEVINSTIDQDAFQLTAQDFWWLMYWQRVNSYPRAPMRIQFQCRNEEHLKLVKDKKLPIESLKTVTMLAKNTLEDVRIEDPKVVGSFIEKVFNESSHHTLLYPARVCDIVEGIEMMDALLGEEAFGEEIRERGSVELDADLAFRMARRVSEHADEEWFNQYASHIHPQHGATLKERREYLSSMGPEIGYDIFQDIDQFRELSRHGVKENVHTNCEGCGAVIETVVSIDALNFFPGLQ